MMQTVYYKATPVSATQIGEDKREINNNNNLMSSQLYIHTIVSVRRQNNFLYKVGVPFLKFAAYSTTM